MPDQQLLLTIGVFVVAVLYSSVGHAGASGYIAVMSLLSMPPAVVKPTALVLNILVATIGSFQFWRAGHFSWHLFWPFALLSVPLAAFGGYLVLPSHVFQMLVGVVLLYSSWRFVTRPPPEREPADRPVGASIAIGGGIGLLSGLTGTGGGIFLTPVLLFAHWARAKNAAAVSALFILVNSIAGLAGNVASSGHLPTSALAPLAAAGIGGLVGSWLGSNRFDPVAIKRLLAAVLLIAGLKLLTT